MFKRISQWIRHRFAFEPIAKHILRRRVAKGAWYQGDGATLTLLFLVLLGTGPFMALSYTPHIDSAHDSVRYLTDSQVLGWFIRALHYWAAGFMVLMLFFHLFRQIFIAGYKSPREGTWLIGLILFCLVIVMSFTGYVLRWDERGFYGLKVALHIFYDIPLIGDHLVRFVQGGEGIGTPTLTRIYSLHVIFGPILLLAFIGLHLYLVIVRGTTSKTEREVPVATAEEQKRIYEQDAHSEDRGEYFFPSTVLSSGAMAGVVFLIVLGFSVFAGPRELMSDANTVDIVRPAEEWWFAWYSSLIALLPPRFASIFSWVLPLTILLILAALPFVDRSPYRGYKKRPLAVTIVVLASITLLVLSTLRKESPWTAWPSAELPPLPEDIQVSADLLRGRDLYLRYGCTSCHSISGVGAQVGPDLSRTSKPMSKAELIDYIRQPPESVAMPAYGHRLTEEEIDDLADFVMAAQSFPRKER